MLPVDAEETGIPFARSIIRAQTEHQHIKDGEPTQRYFISSLPPGEVSAQRYAELVRGHWNIENGSHWQRDNLWREDGHLMRGHVRAHILSTLRQVALHQHSMHNLRCAKPRPISHLAQSATLNLPQTIKLLLSTS